MRNFGRYPPELLVSQVRSESDTTREPIILGFGDYDYSASLFDSSTGGSATYSLETLNFMTELHGKLIDKYAIRVHEFRDSSDVVHDIIRTRNRYGEIAFMLLSDHGSQKSITLGRDPDTGISKLAVSDIQPYSYKKRHWFKQDAQILLIACSTGKSLAEGNNIAQEISLITGCDVIAPDADTHFRTALVLRDAHLKNVSYGNPIDKVNTYVYRDGKPLIESIS